MSCHSELRARVEAVLRHGQFVKGPEVAEFEEAMRHAVGVRHAIGCNSGTDALILALKAAGIGPGDKVIVPAFTFQATANAVKWVGADPVFVDICERDFSIDLDKVERSLDEHGAAAVIAVNMFGIPAAYPALRDIRENHKDTVLIEDAAQSMGSKLNGHDSGSLADIGCTSFYPGKSLAGIGDGGMVFTAHDVYATRIRSFHDHGRQNMTGFSKYWATNPGMNSRLDTIQAAALLVRLKDFPAEREFRSKQVESYRRYFADKPVLLPVILPGMKVNFSYFPVLYDNREARDAAAAEFFEAGARVIYPWPLHMMGAFVERPAAPLHVAESVCLRILAFPVVHTWEANRCLCQMFGESCNANL